MKIRTIVSRWSLGLLYAEELPAVAGDLLQAGYDNQALREVAGMSKPTLREAGELFDRAMVEAGLKPLSKSEAVQRLAWDVAKGIVEGEVAPASGARQLAGLWSGNRGVDELRAFYGCTDEYDEHPEAKAEIEDEIRALARAFMSAHPDLAA